MVIPQSSYGALSVTSTNVIQGKAPTFTGLSGENKLGFRVGNTSYNEGEGNIIGGVEKEFNAGLRLDEFVIKQLTKNDFTILTDYYDGDGDEADQTLPFTMGTVKYEWKDKNGVKITDLENTIGCSGLTLPLTLKITLPDVQVHSKYGKPKSSEIFSLSKSYQITSTSGICFAKPNQMVVSHGNTWYGFLWADGWGWNRGWIERGDFGGGYSKDFDPVNGFKASATTKFPMTAFSGAKFQLIMIGAQTDYNFNVIASPSNSVSVDNSGFVTFHSKPSGIVTINANLKSDTSVVHAYSFRPSLWFEPQSGNADKYARLKNKCLGKGRLPSRINLTNTPQAVQGPDRSVSDNYFTRAIGPSVFAEWGYTTSGTYPGSQWAAGWYWTRESGRSDGDEYDQYAVGSGLGNVGDHYDYYGRWARVVCVSNN
ncbi:hypothetical protein RCS94_03165 [Orbaceae bacterium ac157xtp]